MGEARRRGSRGQRLNSVLAQHGVRPMSHDRYEAFVAWTRSPTAGAFADEKEFYSTIDEKIIGVVIADRIDGDFSYVCLGRDAKHRFRCVDLNASLSSLAVARQGLFTAMKQLAEAGEDVFPQGDESEDRAGVDLFEPVVAETRWHPSFRLLRTFDQWSPAVGVLREMMRHFVDIDGNFVEQFQTTGFDSRLWELYLYAYMMEEGLYVERPKQAPDFSVSDGNEKVFIEAVIVGPTDNAEQTPEELPPERSQEELMELLRGKVAIKFGSALYSKLSRKPPYWELPHVAGRPLVFAIADFHEKQSMTWTTSALIEYLYGVTHDFKFDRNGQLIISALHLETHEYQGKKIPSGFFRVPDATHVGAVLFSSSGTISKFNRKGRLAGFGIPNMRLVRYGLCHDHAPNAAVPRRFMREIEPGKCEESWGEGLSMYHNPNAIHPVPIDLFPSIAHHRWHDGKIQSLLPEFHPYGSITMNMKITDG
jgi:hypothetical protein